MHGPVDACMDQSLYANIDKSMYTCRCIPMDVCSSVDVYVDQWMHSILYVCAPSLADISDFLSPLLRGHPVVQTSGA